MKINELPQVMIKCLVLTIIVEIVVALILRVKDKKDFLNIILVNILTNPIVVALSVYINMYFGLKARNTFVLIAEIIIFLVEGFIYKLVLKHKKINPFILSLILNISSYVAGLIW